MCKAFTLLAAFALSACVIVEDVPDGGTHDPADTGFLCYPGSKLPGCNTGGGGGGGGGGIDLDAGVTKRGFPGSGKDGDPGTGVLWLVRLDRGSANLADAEQTLVKQTNAALKNAGLTVNAVVAISMYDGHVIWGAHGLGAGTQPGLADALRREAQTAPASPPTSCALSFLNGISLSSLSDGAGQPFAPRPSALLVGALDHGARPLGFDSCATDYLSADPQRWQTFYEGPLPRLQTHYAFVATAEQQPVDQMRQRCLAVAGFPSQVLDALQPSPARFFDPLASTMLAAQPGLSSRADLCNALGSSWPGVAASMASDWVAVLSRLQ